jgi:2-polyprenyl-6-methoxyphenol hydroxylase-like FAD-dependent oxidoreductase
MTATPSRRVGDNLYDAIVVGARCAGSSVSMLLARQGRNVLVLDRNAFPSDRMASTHMVWHSGVEYLARWGLLDRLRASGCPPMRNFNLDLGELVFAGHAPPAGDTAEAYAPRRLVLDDLLLTAAADAGVEVRTRCSVRDLIAENDRVVGVRFTDEHGKVHEARASLVVGADGEKSTVARLVGATSYDVLGRLAGTIWAYFADLPIDDMEFYARPGRMIYSWRTNDALTVAGICFPFGEFRAALGDRGATMHAELDALAPGFGERVRDAERVSRWRTGCATSFCRAPVGKGWCLLGDAGLTMDPITAAGITNAFRDATVLAEAVDEGLGGDVDGALAGFEERRNATSTPLYQFTSEMARLEAPTQEVIDLFVGLSQSQDDTDAYFGVFAQTVPVSEFFAPDNIQRISAAAAPA